MDTTRRLCKPAQRGDGPLRIATLEQLYGGGARLSAYLTISFMVRTASTG